jgi:hypothetical protein
MKDEDDAHEDLLKRIERALNECHGLNAPDGARAAVLLTVMASEGIRLKLKKREKRRSKKG